MSKKMYTVEEAAKKLGLERSYIRRLLAKGELKGKKWGRDWMVLNLDYQRKRKPKGVRNYEKVKQNSVV